jgi:hypothetical protein
MPRTAIAVQDVSTQPPFAASITLTTVDAVNNMMLPNDGKTVLLIQNPTGGSLAITVVSVADEFNRLGDLSVGLAAGGLASYGPFPLTAWNQTGTDRGYVYVNPGAGLKVGALRLAA